MKVAINTDDGFTEPEITVNWNHETGNAYTADLERFLFLICGGDRDWTAVPGGDAQVSTPTRVVVSKDGVHHILTSDDIIYIDTNGRLVFCYTDNGWYECNLKLYELEGKLANDNFLRVSKSCIVNFTHIKAIESDINQRLLLTMKNDNQIVVSRQYAGSIRKRLQDAMEDI